MWLEFQWSFAASLIFLVHSNPAQIQLFGALVLVVDMAGAGNGDACLWPTSQQNAFCTQCRPQRMGEETTFCLRRRVFKQIHLCETYVLQYIFVSFDMKSRLVHFLCVVTVEKHLAGTY